MAVACFKNLRPQEQTALASAANAVSLYRRFLQLALIP